MSLTITAPTTAVALAAPLVGRLADRIGLRRIILWSSVLLAIATALAATSVTLPQLVAWRFVQGIVTPGIFAVTMVYIHEEWPAARAGRATAAYISGTVTGGFTGRAVMGLMAADGAWRAGFIALAVLTSGVTAALFLWLPPERRARVRPPSASRGALSAHVRHPQLMATYAVGFCVLCTQVAMFTYITFPLAAPPFGLSTAALGSLFVVYLIGAVVTPLSGRWIDFYGHRAAFTVAVAIGVAGALLTLSPRLVTIVIGLAIFATSVFMAQASASSHVGAHAEQGRGLALGLYATFYYAGGSVGGALPSVLWNHGAWPACVAFIIGVQLVMLAVVWTIWKGPQPSDAIVPI